MYFNFVLDVGNVRELACRKIVQDYWGIALGQQGIAKPLVTIRSPVTKFLSKVTLMSLKDLLTGIKLGYLYSIYTHSPSYSVYETSYLDGDFAFFVGAMGA
jgi:hypothetical protein